VNQIVALEPKANPTGYKPVVRDLLKRRWQAKLKGPPRDRQC
jgi:hypothetical protein